MQSLNVIQLTLEQLEKLSHKLPNWTTVNFEKYEDHIQQIDEIYLYSMPSWLIILTTVLGTVISVIGLVIYYHCTSK